MQEIPLNCEVSIPAVAVGCAFGNWTDESKPMGFRPEQASLSITQALKAGYRAFDGAHAYQTERLVGAVLARQFAQETLARSDVFLVSKICHPRADILSPMRTWNHADVLSVSEHMIKTLWTTLDDLGVGYVDLLLLHWPGTFAETDEATAKMYRKEMWTQMIAFQKAGLARAIGVCNHSKKHMTELVDGGYEIIPAVNQIECHPYCVDKELIAYCASKNVRIMSYSPFASGAFGMLQDPVLLKIAEAHKVPVGQVILRWHNQEGRVVLPKSTSEKRLRENLDFFHFELTAQELKDIDALSEGKALQRTCPAPDAIL